MMKSGDGTLPDLPADIIADILSRLPVRSLCQFRCVSKQFLSLISNPKFIRQHFDRNNRNTQQAERLFLLSESNDCYTLDLKSPNLKFLPVIFRSEPNPFKFIKIWGSCDGLILISDDYSSYFIVNPSTREFRELPVSPNFRDSLTYFHKNGFGFDPSCDDYKVVRISHELHKFVGNSVSVYDLRSDSWRQINSCPYEITQFHNQEGVLLSGALHWLCESRIISFSLANENFSYLSFPSDIGRNFELDLLGVIQRCLSVFDYSFGAYGSIDVWVMEEYGVRDSWKRFTIDCSSYSIITQALSLRNGRVLLNFGTCLELYDPKEDEYEQLEVQGFQSAVFAIGYVESLLRCNNAINEQ